MNQKALVEHLLSQCVVQIDNVLIPATVARDFLKAYDAKFGWGSHQTQEEKEVYELIERALGRIETIAKMGADNDEN